MTTIISREEWGAREPRNAPTGLDTNNVALHYLASPSDGSADSVRGIQNHHIDANGWNDIAYNWLVNQNGDVYVGRGLSVRSAANGSVGANNDFHAIALMLDVDQEPTQQMLDSVKELILQVRDSSTRGSAAIVGHGDLFPTACPGNFVRALINAGDLEPDRTVHSIDETAYIVEPDPVYDGVLSTGSRGSKVRILQSRLVGLGFSVGSAGIDGVYGFDTANAVKELQVQAGFPVNEIDGVYGPDTARELQAWEDNKRRAVPPFPGLQSELKHTPEGTRQVQEAINAIAGKEVLKVDGDFGPLTGDQVQDIQRFFSLSDDRVVGKITWSVLHGSFTYEAH